VSFGDGMDTRPVLALEPLSTIMPDKSVPTSSGRDEVHAHKVHAHEMQAREVHTYEGFYEDLARQNTVARPSQLQ